MADPTREVMNELVRLMRGDVDLKDLDDDALFALAAAAQGGRETLRDVAVQLHDVRKYTFLQIAERLGVAESTASRWVKTPVERRYRPEPQPPEPDQDEV